MTLRLILMRHAKSDWNSPASGDFDRPLNPRGRKNATAIGQWLAENDYVPDLVLCSAAARTRETLDLVMHAFQSKPAVKYSENLYLASPESMFQTLRSESGQGKLMMLAHNPGSAILASALVRAAPDHERFQDYPTAAVTIIDFAMGEWADIGPQSGTAIDFAIPKDL